MIIHWLIWKKLSQWREIPVISLNWKYLRLLNVGWNTGFVCNAYSKNWASTIPCDGKIIGRPKIWNLRISTYRQFFKRMFRKTMKSLFNWWELHHLQFFFYAPCVCVYLDFKSYHICFFVNESLGEIIIGYLLFVKSWWNHCV